MLFQLVHDLSVCDHRIASKVFNRFRQWISRYHDPIVRYNLCGGDIAIRLSHQLPHYRRQNPLYCDNLTRLAAFIRREMGPLRMIDVGANVGDSYYLSKPESGDHYLLIEGDRTYFRLLRRNVPDDPSVECVEALLSDQPSAGEARFVLEGGTARVVAGDGDGSGGALESETLDRILESHPLAQASNLLKTDVDGYDSKVLMGGTRLLAETAPIIFFEHHPRLLDLAGEADDYIFAELAERGYESFIFYDNLGYMITCFDIKEVRFIKDLLFYARCKEYYYYDICCFPNILSNEMSKFMDEEKKFLGALSPEPVCPGCNAGRREM